MRSAVILGGLFPLAVSVHAALDWQALPALPDREGFAGSYAGESRGVLIVAGGANFPDKRPWEGGTKTWYDRVFLLEAGATSWSESGHLPCAAGYGASVQLDDGVLLIGGGDAQRNFSTVWLARVDRGQVNFEPWPALPRPLAMTTGVRVGRIVYVAGGIDQPDAVQAQNVFYALDLDHVRAGWRELAPWPGPGRILATAGTQDGEFFLFSGAQLTTGRDGKSVREWLRDAYRYAPTKGWKRIADLPRVAVAAPSPTVVVDGKLVVIGGDDGLQVNVAPTAHRGFPRDVLAYDVAANAWIRTGEVPFSLVTTPLAIWRNQIVVSGGEQRPGVRSPAVWAARLK